MNKDLEKRVRQYYFHNDDSIPMCANCRHFYMHYVRTGKRYFSIHQGHCVTPRMKMRDAWDLCEFFTPRAASVPVPAQTK